MDNQKLALAITKALAYTENGGKPDVNNLKAGKTGETKSIFQFTPDTWKNYAKQILGDEKAQMTPENEAHVTHTKVSKWLEEGYKPEQIASMWNAGVGQPDAYGGKFSDGSPSKGINKKYGVQFDVPSYAKKVTKYTGQFLKELDGSEAEPKPVLTPTPIQETPNPIKPNMSSGILPQKTDRGTAMKANPGLIKT